MTKILDLLKNSRIIGFFSYESIFLTDIFSSLKDYDMTVEEIKNNQKEIQYAQQMKESIHGSPWCWFKDKKTWEPEKYQDNTCKAIDTHDNKITLKCVSENNNIFYIQFYDGNIRIGLGILKRTYDVEYFQIPMSEMTRQYYLERNTEAGTPLKGKSDIIKEHCSKNNIPIKEINISPEDVYKEVIPGKGVSNNGTGKYIERWKRCCGI